MPAPEDDAGAAESGYAILIRVDGQGQISVGVENESGGAPEPAMGAEPAEDEMSEMGSMQPAPNIKAALTMALDIYKSNGTATDTAGNSDQFKAGFSGQGM